MVYYNYQQKTKHEFKEGENMLKSKEGQKVPAVSFPVRVGDEWKVVTTDELFKGKKVIVFSLPGAFTPTCSSSHLPRYDELAPAFKANGVDDIIVVSVNDTFVMNAWADNQDTKNITFLPDGSGHFTKGMDMLVSKDDLGFGDRSWRYSMLVDDGVVVKQFIEPDVEGDPFEVSDADTMLEYLAPHHELPKSITIFTKPSCSFCKKAKEILKEKGLHFEEIVLGRDATMTSVRGVSGQSTAPQIFIDGEYIGGKENLEKYFS